jgi:hypothetical protein
LIKLKNVLAAKFFGANAAQASPLTPTSHKKKGRFRKKQATS